MLDAFALAALALLVLGVVGSAVPALPGAALSLAGVLLYWWSTGYADPGPLALAGFLAVGLLTVAVDWFAGAMAARAGGASMATTALAALAGLLFLFVAGPLGVLVGVAGTVFAVEFYRNRDADASGRTAAYATVGMLGSAVVQVLLTGAMLVAFLLVLAF
ncbi:MAG: DUF456 domain-containing protein [Haloferacaceae archaeon]